MPHDILIRELDQAFEDAIYVLLWACQAERCHCPPRVQDATRQAFTVMRDLDTLGRIQQLSDPERDAARRDVIRHHHGIRS